MDSLLRQENGEVLGQDHIKHTGCCCWFAHEKFVVLSCVRYTRLDRQPYNDDFEFHGRNFEGVLEDHVGSGFHWLQEKRSHSHVGNFLHERSTAQVLPNDGPTKCT